MSQPRPVRLLVALAAVAVLAALALASAGVAYNTPKSCVLKGPCVSQPVAGRNFDLSRSSGHVLIRLAGTRRFVPLLRSEQLELGAVIDAVNGRVDLCSAQTTAKGYACAAFYDGEFRVTQIRAGGTLITVLSLVGGSFSECRAGGHRYLGARGAAGSRRPTKPVRRLWGNGHGAFRTVGRSSTATVRGTIWLTADYCDGTLTRVTRDSVAVRNRRTGHTQLVRAGHRLFVALK